MYDTCGAHAQSHTKRNLEATCVLHGHLLELATQFFFIIIIHVLLSVVMVSLLYETENGARNTVHRPILLYLLPFTHTPPSGSGERDDSTHNTNHDGCESTQKRSATL